MIIFYLHYVDKNIKRLINDKEYYFVIKVHNSAILVLFCLSFKFKFVHITVICLFAIIIIFCIRFEFYLLSLILKNNKFSKLQWGSPTDFF